MNISIVTGTLNRIDHLKTVIDNTVGSNRDLELVIVDGGSTDGTVEFLRGLEHDRVKRVYLGSRSPYWHYMNIGIRESSHELVCQWNDDVVLLNDWTEVMSEIDDDHDYFVFSWRDRMFLQDFTILDGVAPDGTVETVMNYGIYRKRVFREAGMYDDSYNYYYCDGDMSLRAQRFGFRPKRLPNIRCECLPVEWKRAYHLDRDAEEQNYLRHLGMYRSGVFDVRNILDDGGGAGLTPTHNPAD